METSHNLLQNCVQADDKLDLISFVLKIITITKSFKNDR
jgi:hypothetical protein